MAARVRAPGLTGSGGWINTGGKDLRLADLRGRVVVLDFWTSCCVNCLHVLDELRPLEQRHPGVLVVLGVHCPKFPHEAEHVTVVDAVERHGVRHPVLDDPDLTTRSQYAVRAWPTLCVVDPEGYVVLQVSGEGHVEQVAQLVDELVREHERKGTLRRGDSPYVPATSVPSELLFPGGVLRLPGGDLLVSDTAHHRLVRLAPDGETVRRSFGTGERGLVDGLAPRFAEPRGTCLLDDGLVLVADSANHALRTLDLTSGEVVTVAGTGEPRRPGDSLTGPATGVRLSTPWDVCVHAGEVVVAMAGAHQLWALRDGLLDVLAGTGGEGLRDGEARRAYLAQPSGLASDGERLWFVDAETSSLRWYARVEGRGHVGTAVGTGLFAFGRQDGPAADALLQHPLGLAVLPDGSIAVCDTYNDAVLRYDPATGLVSTLATGLPEPAAAVVDDGGLVVVASAAHRVERLPLPTGPRRLPLQQVAGDLEVQVRFETPPWQSPDERYGPSTRLLVRAEPAGMLEVTEGEGLVRRVRLSAGGVLHVTATAATCDDDVPHAACRLHRQEWVVPVHVVAGGADHLALRLD